MKIQRVNRITNCLHLNLFAISYVDMKGNEKSWEIATRRNVPRCVAGEFERADAVVIVPFHRKKNRLVIIKEFRVALGGYQYGFPAGLMDEGETIGETAERELAEETGLRLTQISRISPPVYSSTGMTDESVSVVFAECDGEPSNEGNESSEDISIMFISPLDASALCMDARLKFDVKTWLVLSSFAEQGHI